MKVVDEGTLLKALAPLKRSPVVYISAIGNMTPGHLRNRSDPIHHRLLGIKL
jgi:hypothetical protein